MGFPDRTEAKDICQNNIKLEQFTWKRWGVKGFNLVIQGYKDSLYLGRDKVIIFTY